MVMGYRLKVKVNRLKVKGALLLTIHFSLFTLGFAQSSHSTMFGRGTVNIYDSYLSPYSFTGYELRIIRETSRPTKMLDGNVSVQTLLNFDGGYLDNIAGNAHEWVAGIRYSFNWHYNFRPMLDSRLKLMAGPGISGYLGGIYNTRNGNNPAQQKTDIMINLSAQASYDFTLWNKPLHARYELTVPFIGTAFSPTTDSHTTRFIPVATTTGTWSSHGLATSRQCSICSLSTSR